MTATLDLMRVHPGVFRSSLAVVLALPVLAAPRHARAESFLELGGGISVPVGDDDWTNAAESSPKLALKAGAIHDKLGGMVAFDWTPVNLDNEGFAGPLAAADVSGHRFRVLAHIVGQVPIQRTIHLEARAGIGADIAHVSASGNVLGFEFDGSDTDVGLGFEFGAGVWINVSTVQIGAQVALPGAIHNHEDDPNDNDDIPIDYTSYDFDLMFGVRLLSH